jgi:hypothetical protein
LWKAEAVTSSNELEAENGGKGKHRRFREKRKGINQLNEKYSKAKGSN